jgi:large subunit ribosomal protein L29
MKAKEIAERETEDLATLEKELRRQLFEYRLKNHTNSLDDTSLSRKTRRDIARVKTILAQRAKSTGAKR